MREQDYAVHNSVQAEQLEVSRVLRNTYGLLALTLAFSGVMAFVAQQMRVGYPNIFVVLIGFYGLFFLTNKLRDSAWGLVSAFALTGFMGFLLGPILNRYLGMQGGAEVVSSAFAMTALVFGGLSAYVLITRKDMSFLGGFITAGFFVLLGATLASMFFQISGLQLAISAGFVLFSSVCILFQTSAIIHGGERNYIMATISLYVSIRKLQASEIHAALINHHHLGEQFLGRTEYPRHAHAHKRVVTHEPGEHQVLRVGADQREHLPQRTYITDPAAMQADIQLDVDAHPCAQSLRQRQVLLQTFGIVDQPLQLLRGIERAFVGLIEQLCRTHWQRLAEQDVGLGKHDSIVIEERLVKRHELLRSGPLRDVAQQPR